MVNAFRTLFVTVNLFAAALAAPKAARDTTDILAQLKGITGEFSTISTEITAFNNQGGNPEIAVVSNMLGSLPVRTFIDLFLSDFGAGCKFDRQLHKDIVIEHPSKSFLFIVFFVLTSLPSLL